MSDQVLLRVEPVSGRFDVHDDRWLAQVTGLVAELRQELGHVSTPGVAVAGTKGSATSIVVSLASAGTLTALVELLRSWLIRDRTRSVKVSFDGDGELAGFEVHGNGLDPAAFDDLLRAVTKRVADPG